MNLDQEVNLINEELEKMFSLTREFLRRSLVYYLSGEDSKFIPTIDDNQVNASERNVESWCLSILLKERVYAKDLRRVTGCLKLVTDIERIGDHARDIKEAADKIGSLKEQGIDMNVIQPLVDYVLKMYDDSVCAFVTYDVPLAEEICSHDNEVDDRYSKVLAEVINEAKGNRISAEYAIYTNLVLKYLERVADHAVNIAEWTVFIKNGFHKDSVII